MACQDRNVVLRHHRQQLVICMKRLYDVDRDCVMDLVAHRAGYVCVQAKGRTYVEVNLFAYARPDNTPRH